MRLHVDHRSKTPVSDQVRSQVAAGIARGRLSPGERLPPVRELAAKLRLAPNTVAKAYRALEGDGLVEGRGRRGTFVREPLGVRAAGAETRLADAARAYADRATRLGFGAEAAVAAAKRALGHGLK